MTEAQWLASDDPAMMLRLLLGQSRLASPEVDLEGSLHDEGDDRCRLCQRRRRDGPCRHVSDRKLLLFACAWWRSLPPVCEGDEEILTAVEEAGRWKDPCGVEDVDAAWLLRDCQAARGGGGGAALLLKDIVGNPWRRVELPLQTVGYSWGDARGRGVLVRDVCPWLTPDVLSLAQAAYDERLPGRLVCPASGGRRRLPGGRGCRGYHCLGEVANPAAGTLDCVRMAILADALEEAGCADCVLRHLRSPGPHVRGCWVIDLLLGRD